MAALPPYVPIPGFPRWTGMRVRLGAPRATGATVTVVLTVPRITYRARLWAMWRVISRQGVPDAAARQ